MRGREPLQPARRRRIPSQFSWIDHRLVRDGHLTGLSSQAQSLYLFLVTVADAEGLSWYSDPAACRQMGWDEDTLPGARSELVRADLVAYRKPLYQVLDLGPCPEPERRIGEVTPIGQLIEGMIGGGR
jgi:hypothetical protein